ncbi:alpha/beta hydrolase [Actinomadura geliboluensis]|uniref:alpha/beta hydrolase n=1 Tax=Actinomadura geliboluensis TaxID=882440 RepID=UPI0036B8BD7C
MNDVAELKRFAVVHARSGNLPGHREVLARIETDDGDAPRSWVGEWSAAAERLGAEGRVMDACRAYAMARFPYVDGPARQRALERCTAAFEQARPSGVERLDVETAGGLVRCWTAGLSADRPRPVLLIMGGIVTVKEQWAPVLARVGRLGMAGIVTEMPGTGENTLRYDAKSPRMLSAVLDAVAGRADASRAYAMTLSFSGHMALRAALDDSRIRGVITTGAPVREFFTDTAWRPRVPRITMDTLAHMAGVPADELGGELAAFALSDAELAELAVPVRYVASSRDEIIPPAEAARLPSRVRDLRMLVHDDVHGSPAHTVETQLWCLRELVRMSGAGLPQRAVFDLLWRAARLRGALPGN